MRVLALDDDPIQIEIYEHIFGGNRLSVEIGRHNTLDPGEPVPLKLVTVQRGYKAIHLVAEAIAHERPFAVALLDLHLNDTIDGIDVAQELRRIDPSIHIIFVTGRGDLWLADVVARVPPADKLLYVQKPAHALELEHLVISCALKWHSEQVSRATLEDLEAAVRSRTQALEKANQRLAEDIARRREAEAQLRLVTQALEAAANAIVITDVAARIQWCNPAFTELTGYTRAEVIGCGMRILRSDRHPPGFYETLWQTIARGEIWQGEIINKRKDGSYYVEDQTIGPVFSETNVITHFIAVKQDVTERRALEEEAQLRQQQLIQADKMASLGILVSGVAHEINNPNQFILSNISLLTRMWNDAVCHLECLNREKGEFTLGGLDYLEAREVAPQLFRDILQGSRRIRNIVSELRTYSMESVVEVHELVDLNQVIRGALSLLSNLLKKATDHYLVDCSPDLPPARGSFQRLEQVIINLVQNACQSLVSRDRAIRISTCHDKASRQVCLSVEDEGSGIAPEILPRITDPFFTTKRESGGTGLGLSICSRIVEQHGGSLRFFSSDEGTRVEVWLPQADAEPTEA
jgi:PAS domain S-box-containing protein